MAGIVDQIKNDVRKSGSNKGKIVYVRDGEKRRFRFLTDADDGMEITFHDSFADGITPTPCQKVFGRDCEYCESEGIRTRSHYVWSAWDYEVKEVKLFMFAVNNCSPIPQLINFYDTYGTICDRDYVVSVSGKQQNKSYGVVPMDKVKFRNDKAKPYTQKQILKMLDKAFPCDGASNSDEDEEDDYPLPKPSGRNAKNEWDGNGKLPSLKELEEMPPIKLYNMCKERDIEVEARKGVDYYIEKLDEWSQERDDYDEDQDWGDEEEEKEDYESMTPKELYNLCKERKIEAESRKPAKYYITLLKEDDKANDDWGDSEQDEWEDD